MATIIDRRDQVNTGATSRDRFLERNKNFAKKAINQAIGKGNVTDIGKGGVDVVIPREDLMEPTIQPGKGGVNKKVLPGNKQFHSGDRLPRPKGGGGQGGPGPGEAGQDGDGEDDFVFHLSEEEFLNLMFEDLELPNMVNKSGEDATATKQKRSGYAMSGIFPNLHLQRSKRQQMGRLFAASAAYNNDIIDLLSKKRDIMAPYDAGATASFAPPSSEWIPNKVKIDLLEFEVLSLTKSFDKAATPDDMQAVRTIDEQLDALVAKRKAIPRWNESTDLRFRTFEPEPQPTTRAAMFCLMDVSASMDEETKSNAKIFFFLLYRFLKRKYDKVDTVFIRHTTEAEEVDEKEFFYGKKTGGTTVSSALKEELKIIKERYSDGNWNIYGAQASDGDNWGTDNQECEKLMRELLKKTQAHFYTEITKGRNQDLWNSYKKIAAEAPDQFFMGKVEARKDIYPLFRKFFEPRMAKGVSPTAAFAPV